jgi:hypothetical protein
VVDKEAMEVDEADGEEADCGGGGKETETECDEEETGRDDVDVDVKDSGEETGSDGEEDEDGETAREASSFALWAILLSLKLIESKYFWLTSSQDERFFSMIKIPSLFPSRSAIGP